MSQTPRASGCAVARNLRGVWPPFGDQASVAKRPLEFAQETPARSAIGRAWGLAIGGGLRGGLPRGLFAPATLGFARWHHRTCRSPAPSVPQSNPKGCQTVAGGRQTSGTVGNEHPTPKGSQTDGGGGYGTKYPNPPGAGGSRPGAIVPLACLRHAIAFSTLPEVERPPPLTLRRRAPPPATFWQPSGLLVRFGILQEAEPQARPIRDRAGSEAHQAGDRVVGDPVSKSISRVAGMTSALVSGAHTAARKRLERRFMASVPEKPEPAGESGLNSFIALRIERDFRPVCRIQPGGSRSGSAGEVSTRPTEGRSWGRINNP
jgi:hypothetical protein